MAAAMMPTCAPDLGADCLFCDPLCTACSPSGHLQPWLQVVILPQAIQHCHSKSSFSQSRDKGWEKVDQLLVHALSSNCCCCWGSGGATSI